MMKSIGLLVIGILIVDVAVITGSFMQQSSKLTEAGSNISALESQVTELNGELVTLRGSVAVLQSRLEDSGLKSSRRQTYLTASEANAAALKASLTKARAEYSKALATMMANMTAQQKAPFVNYDPGLGILVNLFDYYDYGAGMGVP